MPHNSVTPYPGSIRTSIEFLQAPIVTPCAVDSVLATTHVMSDRIHTPQLGVEVASGPRFESKKRT